MRNNIIISLFFACLLLSCKHESKNCLNFHYDEKEYSLIESKKDEFGKTFFELFKNKYDTNKYFSKTYWDNGNIQSSLYYTGRVKNGPFKMFDVEGNIDLESMYYMDKKNGLEIYYKRGLITDFTIYHNGSKLDMDSSLKIAMLKAISSK